jgi:AraC-like DNA-binding protein
MSGETKILFDGKIFYDKADSIRFLPKMERNIIYTTETIKNGVCIDIFFDTVEPIDSEAFTISVEHSNLIKQLFQKANSSWYRKEEGYEYEVKGYLYEIFAELQRRNSYMPKDKYQKIIPGIKYIHENFTSNFPVEILGDKCSISYSYFRKLFTSKFGISPKKYILNLRINRAMDLLKTNLYSIIAISEILGYQNEYYFSRSFKKVIGVPPSVFKKESRATEEF